MQYFLLLISKKAAALPDCCTGIPPTCLCINLGSGYTFEEIVIVVTNYLAVFAIFVCGAIFVVGTLLMVISRGKEDQIQKGKDLMIQSLIGLVVILAAYGIVWTVFHVLYNL